MTAQILAETHPSVHGSPFVAHDPDTVETFPVPPDPAGKRFNFSVYDCFLKCSEYEYDILHESIAVKRDFT